MEKYMLGLDIGTTNVKAALYTYSGTEVFVKSAAYPLYTDEFGAATQSANEIKEKVFETIRASTIECARRNIRISFIVFSAAMHSLLAVDGKGNPMTPLLTWGDRQAEHYLNELKNEADDGLYQRTGIPLHSMNPLVKLYWLKKDYPEIIKQAHKFSDIKTFILYQFFNEYFMDYSLANATGLFNMFTFSWDKKALKLAGVEEGQLPQLVPTTEVLKEMDTQLAQELGLESKTPIVIGASDGCLANLGVNAIAPGKVALTIGTSGAIRSVTSQPTTDPDERIFCYMLTENLWVVGGPVNNGGIVLDWAKNRWLNGGDLTGESYNLMMQQIETVQPGADNLFFHPYLLGERAPIWLPEAKGGFFGLDLHHQNAHMMRAVLEGINLNLYAVYTVIAEVIEVDTGEVLVTGGFTKSATWLQMLADIFGVQLALTDVSENACFGAALLGLFAMEEIEDFAALEEMLQIERRIKPIKTTHQFYQNHFKKYQQLTKHYIKMLQVLD